MHHSASTNFYKTHPAQSFIGKQSFIQFLSKDRLFHQPTSINESLQISNAEVPQSYYSSFLSSSVSQKQTRHNSFSLTPQSRHFLLNNTSLNNNFGVVTICWFDGWAREYSRKMLLRTYGSCEIANSEFQQEIQLNEESSAKRLKNLSMDSYHTDEESGFQIHSKVQIGQNMSKQPINWLYFELDLNKILTRQDREIAEVAILMSSYVFYEIPGKGNSKIGTDSISIFKNAIEKLARSSNQDFDGSPILMKSENAVPLDFSQRSFDTDLGRSRSLKNIQSERQRQNLSALSIKSMIFSPEAEQQAEKSQKSSIFPEFVFLCPNKQSSENPQLIKTLSAQNIRHSFLDIGIAEFSICKTTKNLNQSIDLSQQSHSLQASPLKLRRIPSCSFQQTRIMAFTKEFFDNQKDKKDLSCLVGETSKFSKTKREIKPEIIQKILKNARKYTQGIIVKRNPVDDSPINAKILIGFIEGYMREALALKDSNKKVSVIKIWNTIQESEAKKLQEHCLQIYQNKFKDLTMGKSMISQQIFEQAHKRAKQAALIAIQKSSQKNKTLFNQIQEILKIVQSKKRQQNHSSSLLWGKQLLISQYQSIERKIRNKELKSFSAFKQQITIFRDFFRKKSQGCFISSVGVLNDYFETFILDKIFDGLQFIITQEKSTLFKDLEQARKKISQMQVEERENRKKIGKDESDLLAKIYSLEQRNQYLTIREDLLEKTNSKLTVKIDDLQQMNQSRHIQDSKAFQKQIQALKQELFELSEKLSETVRQNIILQSDIKKQKLLRAEDHRNYDQLISDRQAKQLDLSSRLDMMSMRSITSLSQISDHQGPQFLESGQLVKTANLSIRQLRKQLKGQSQLILSLQDRNSQLKFDHQIRIQGLFAQKVELEMEVKILSQKLMQQQSRTLRFQKVEQQIDNLRRQRQQAIETRQSIQKYLALQKQKASFLQERLRDVEAVAGSLKTHNLELKLKNQEYFEKIRQERKICVEEWVQVEDLELKNKLKDALRVVDVLEKEYMKLKKQNSGYRVKYGFLPEQMFKNDF